MLGAGLGLLFPASSRAALNSVPQALHGRASSRLSFGRLSGAACGATLAGLAFGGGVTAAHLHIALAGGAVLSIVGALVAGLRFGGAPAEPSERRVVASGWKPGDRRADPDR